MGRVRLMLSGGAPLPVATMEFFRILLGANCTCHEGYGQTETSGATTLSMPGDVDIGHVGGPLPCCEVMLVDVPEMNYLRTDRFHGSGDTRVPCEGRGEIWVRGPSVISGYYKDPVETAAAGLDGVSSGRAWLKSGDIGMSRASL
jgi:long-chain acyl-CoA synthetase